MTSLATAGTLGAIGVGTTSAVLTESATFDANLLAAGELDQELCWERADDETECTKTSDTATIDFGSVSPGDSGSATIRNSLTDNPGWLWLRTNCPDGPCGLERVVDVSLYYDLNCDGVRDADEPAVVVDGTPIENLPLCTALTKLREGTLLDGDPETDAIDPVESTGDFCLGFEWEIDDDELLCRDEEFDITFDFYTEQWRHNEEPTRPEPWTGESCGVDCAVSAEDCCPDFQEISFVAFCKEADGEGIEEDAITFTPYYDFEGDPFKLDWESEVSLSWIVLFYAKTFENFDVSGQSSGTIKVGEGTQEEWDGQEPQSPCPGSAECGVRYNFDDDTWDDVCDGGGG